jgi:membrane-bound lytic murein transglycosylase B
MRSARRALVAATLVLLAASCGGGDDDDAAPTTTSKRTTTTRERTTVTTTTEVPAPTSTTSKTETVDPPVAASSPDGLAEQIAKAEATIRDPNIAPEEAAAAGHLLQVAYKKLALTPEWKDAVLAALPPERRGTADANSRAQAQLRALVGTPRDTLPDWEIVAPAPAEELLGHYQAAEAEFGVPWPYLAAIHLVETRLGRIRGLSEAGAQGPMQFMPATWDAYGEGDINSNRDAIRAAARYLVRNGAPDDMRNALWNYNHSDRDVDAIILSAEQMRADARAYVGYYHFQVYYWHTSGDLWLPVGWTRERT